MINCSYSSALYPSQSIGTIYLFLYIDIHFQAMCYIIMSYIMIINVILYVVEIGAIVFELR